ncbi:MAG: succinate dehydrogenase cytochrome b subunit [Chlorobi bacterium]|nr:succinate dehydrogenase cytochrome b subunit [Chlorobiota bacterium]
MKEPNKLLSALTSQVGRKLLTGITGVLLVLFVISHLSGNLALLRSDSAPFNQYTQTLHSFGMLLIIVEIGLGLLILLHAYLGIAIMLRKRAARKQGYDVVASKGGPSRQSLSSRTMAVTGIILLIFLVIHIVQMRFGPNISQGYSTIINGQEVRDLHRLVLEVFSNIWWVAFYVGVMMMLGFHLRHGIWSALQSLAAMKPRYSTAIYSVAFLLAVLLAVGFLILPIWIYINHRGATV